MPKKKNETEEVIEKIFDYTLEDIMGERFGCFLLEFEIRSYLGENRCQKAVHK